MKDSYQRIKIAQSYKRTWIYKEFNLYYLIKVFVPRDLAPLIIQSYSSYHFNSLISKIKINHKTNLVKFHLKRSCCTRMYLPWKINSSCPHSWFNISQLPNVCMIDLLGQLIQMRRCHVSSPIETSVNIHFFWSLHL